MPTILVADDNSNIQKMVTLALKELGITVVAVGNGEAAVKKLPDVRPDVVLADIFMPVRNGYEVCEFVKGDERFAHIPVVLLVGAFDPLDEHEVDRVHADGVLKKPFVPPDPLIAMVKSLLEKGPQTSGAGEAALAAAVAEPPAPTGPKLEKTQQLTPAEIAAATHQPPPAPEPEMEQFGSQPAPMTIDEANSPVAFRDMMEEEAEEAPEEEEEEVAEETEEAAAKPGFEASSVSGYHFPGEIPIPGAAAAATEEAHAAEPAASHEEAAAEAHETSRVEEDHWAGIKDEMKQPDAEQPPIPVQFGESAPMEIVTDEPPEVPSAHEVKQDPALVTSAHEWMAAHPPAEAAPPPAHEEAPEPDFEPMRIEVESASRAPAPSAAGNVDDTQQFFVSPSSAAKPLETIAQDLHEEAVKAAPPPRDTDETQQFMASAVPPAVRAEPEPAAPSIHEEPAHAAPPAQSTWGRVEEVMLPAAPVIAAAAAEFRSRVEIEAPTTHAHEAAPEPHRAESAPAPAAAPPAAGTSPGTGVGPDLLIAAITQKVIEQLDPKTIEKLSRELVRPLIEALIRREIDKD